MDKLLIRFKKGVFAFFILGLCSCKKDWLDAKPDISLVVPKTLNDFKSLMAGTTDAGSFNIEYGTLIEHYSGDFYVSDVNFLSGSLIKRNFYEWAPDPWGDQNNSTWSIPYEKILYTNIVLEGIQKIVPKNSIEKLDWGQIKGSALFFRGAWHYDIAKQFCKPYNKNTAASDLGIPLRLESDFNIPSLRSSVKETYNQIISDIKESALFIPVLTPINDIYKCQPSKSASYALLARIYLAMSEYDSAFVYADKTLEMYNTLIDYNTISTTSAIPFKRFNEEVIFHMKGASYSFLTASRLIADSMLYKSFNDNDLRKTVYFIRNLGNWTLKGSYEGAIGPFPGLATDEIYLIRAECYARKGNTDAALNDLNTLLKKRWKNNGSWVPMVATNPKDALLMIIAERRKELILRGARWTDLRRLNMEQGLQTILTKFINGQTLTLEPNSKLYVFPIHPSVIKLTGMPQNPR